MVVVMEDTVWLPWLPPLGLEVNAGVVDDAMVVEIHQQCHKYRPVDGKEEHRAELDTLLVKELNRVYGSDAEGGGLLVLVVQLVELLVKERPVVETVEPVRDVIRQDVRTW